VEKPSSGAPRPFWTWEWRTSSPYERAYFAYRLSVRPLLALAAIVGAVLVVSWFVGVNPLCVSEEQLQELPRDRHVGPASSATDDIQGFRHRFSANLYAEVVDLSPAVNDLGQIMLPPPGAFDGDCLDRHADPVSECGSVTVGVFPFTLASHPDGETRVSP